MARNRLAGGYPRLRHADGAGNGSFEGGRTVSRVIPVVLDVESFWSSSHSLSKMSPIEYVMHPETEIISCAAKVDGRETFVGFGEENIKSKLRNFDWSDKLVIAHNNEGFDSMILAWRCGVRPKMWGCTLAMARPIHAKTAGGSLAALVEHYGIGKKDQTALINTKGRHLKDFTPEEVADMAKYNKADVDQCWELFQRLLPLTSKDEMRLIDQTIRMLVEPQFVVDRDLLTRTLREEQDRKQKMLLDLATMLGCYHAGMEPDEAAEAVSKVLGSAPKFGQLLKDLGVEVPTKISPRTGKAAPALAKTDAEFLALQDHEDPTVVAACQARLGVKSTLLESRITAFLQAAEAAGGKLPIPTKYYGADTTGRRSGWAYNPLNLPRVSGKPSDALRNCLQAGVGKKVVVADLSGIELRANHFLWRVPSSMALYKADPEKADLYREFAATLYEVEKDAVSKPQRQVGKVAHLGLGYGAGAVTFQKVAKIMGGVDLSLQEARDIVDLWRKAYAEIAAGWKTCHAALDDIFLGRKNDIDPWGLCHTSREGIVSPKGIIRYPDLRQELVTNVDAAGKETTKKEWVYGDGRHKARIYAGKVTENCLAAGTLVLTDSGWKPIESVERADKVHDGDTFVEHAGTISKSVQPCVTIDGVYMTPDHEVLTDEGWKEASQLPRPYRPAVRRADRLESFAQQREAVVLAVPMPVRAHYDEAGAGRDQGGDARRNAKLWVPYEAANIPWERHAWDDQASSVWSVSQHAGPLPTAFASSVEKLRRTRDNGMRTVARVLRAFLGRHGSFVPAWAGLGSQGQQRAVFAGELPVGFPQGKHHEQAHDAPRRCTDIGSNTGYFAVDPVLPTRARASTGYASGQTEGYPVYDILNAGPKHRFVVLGDNGPFVVHNCVQHLSRNVITDAALEMRKETGLNPALEVYDELVYVVDEDKAEDTLATLQAIMRTPPKWWPALVVWSEGSIGDTYGAAK